MRRYLVLLLCTALVYAALLPLPLAGAEEPAEALQQTVRGVILQVEEAASDSELTDEGFESKAYYVDVKITSGEHKGRVVNVYHVTGGNPVFDIFVNPGDRVLLIAETQNGELLNVYIADHVRDSYVYIMLGAFVVLILLLGGRQGAKALFSLLVTGVLVWYVLLPLILRGYSPMPVAVVVSALSIMVTMFVVGGINRKTLAAIAGTVAGVLVAGLLAFSMGTLSKLTGLSHEESQMLLYIPQGIAFNYQGLLFAGIMIGALGAVMDVGMSIASSMFEMKRVNPALSAMRLFRSGMNVGRDIMGTMSNTLILAYAGGAMSLLLLFQAYEIPLIRILNMDKVATELVRALSGSIGLVAAIPLTALAAAWLASILPSVSENSKQASTSL